MTDSGYNRIMVDENGQKTASSLGLISTGTTASMMTGAIVTLITKYVHWKYNVSLDEITEQAIQTIMTTFIGGFAMVLHVLIVKLLNSKGN